MSTRPSTRTLVLRSLAALTALALATGCSTPMASPGAGGAEPSPLASPSAAPLEPSSPEPPSPSLPEVPIRRSSLADGAEEDRGPRPVAVGIAQLGAAVDVEPVGVAEDGQMEIPAFAETAGWYRFGARPGDERGTAVIAAHVDSIASGGIGPFAALAEAREGDEIEVLLEDGSTVVYVVDGVERLAKKGIDWEEVFVRDGPPRLVLVTCGGRFLRELGHYEDNVLVSAAPR